jgi:hypothetical protein
MSDTVIMTPAAVRAEMREEYGDDIPAKYVALLDEWEAFKRKAKPSDAERAVLIEKLDHTIKPWLQARPKIRFNVWF